MLGSHRLTSHFAKQNTLGMPHLEIYTKAELHIQGLEMKGDLMRPNTI